MNKGILKSIYFVFLIILLKNNIYANDFLNETEKEYLSKNKTFNIYVQPNISFYTQTYGNYFNGYIIQYLKLMERKLDIKFNIISDLCNSEAINELEKCNIDIAILPRNKRSFSPKLIFSEHPVGTLKPALLMRKIYQLPPSIHNAENFNLVIAKDHIHLLNRRDIFKSTEVVDTIDESIEKILNQNADIALGYDEIFSAQINNKQLKNLKSIPIDDNINYPINFLNFAVPSINHTLMNIINKTMDNFTLKELALLKEHFFKDVKLKQNNIEINLNQKEKLYLMKKQVLNACVLVKDSPYGDLFQSKYKGIGSHILKIIEEKLDTPIQIIVNSSTFYLKDNLKKGKCDFVNLSTLVLDNLGFVKTKLLFHSPIVVITDNKSLYFNDFTKKLDQTFLIKSSNPILEQIRDKYPNLNLKEVSNEIDALKRVEKGLDYGLITSLYSVSNLFQQNIPDKLKVSGEVPISIPYSFTLLNTEKTLFDILNKIVEEELRNDMTNIINKEVKDQYPEGFDYTIVLLLVLIFILFFIVMSKQHFSLMLQKDNLFKLNESLEDRIKAAIQVNREKDILMYRQNRFASMGEMLGNIAHQWRQPLMELSALLMELRASVHFNNKVENEDVIRITQDSDKVIQFMSNTIEDFRNFFDSKKEKEIFLIHDVINDAIHMMNLSLQQKRIKLEVFEESTELKAYGLKNEYLQVLVNIISNAKDAFISRKHESGTIIIRTKNLKNQTELSIEDTAGGIKEENLSVIFEPFYTKGKINGTGIGLFMSKMIVENHMKGKITVRNTNNGAIITIVVPKSKNEYKSLIEASNAKK